MYLRVSTLSLFLNTIVLAYEPQSLPAGLQTCHWMQHLLDYIVATLRPTLITLFVPMSKDEDFRLADCFLKSAISNTTVLIVDLEQLYLNASIFQLVVFDYPRRINFYAVIYPSIELMRDSSRLKDSLDLMVEIAPRPSRPRVLLILFGSKTLPQTLVDSILLFAWSRKFLDFTIVDQLSVTYHYYNPFLERFFLGRYAQGVNLFPDKLTNLYGYRLKAAATKNPPYVLLERNETGYPLLDRKIGSSFRTLRILANKMNFTYEFPPSSFEYYNEGNEESLFERMYQGEINLSTNHLFIRKTTTQFDKLERSTITLIEEYTALVPVRLNKHIKIPEDLYAYLMTSLFIIVLFYAVPHALKFDKSFWLPTKIVQIILNMTILRQPKRWPERFAFLGLTLFSFNFTISMITTMTEIQFEPYEDTSFTNVSLMGEKGFIPVVLNQFRDITLECEVEENEEFKSRLLVVDDPNDCAIRLNNGEKLVCFMTRYMGERAILDYLKKKVQPRMRLITPYLWSSWKCMVFERGSPFLDGFDRNLEKLRDTGLLARFVYDVTYDWNKEALMYPDEADILSKQVITSSQLMAQLLIGYSVASLVLVLELAISRLARKLRWSSFRLSIL
ncbi:hypothetical protein TSAR_016957 [Trichomalopsis sarcophagae]|uniref:Ionotropic glutamate receptor L-glutamate and glycine-binding domain-containing protein n=1 Tax=Trichomalopsis sarcophagae TaxID=543379 RepID=A0A232ETL0_9HYME|nr:hypothetical protein TSAR_016957 [Trichomalopsis sarcophagae]